MIDPIKVVEQTQGWNAGSWLAAAVVGLVVTIVLTARYFVKGQEKVWSSWMKTQDEKDKILQDMVKDSRETNTTLVRVVEKNSLLIERNNQALESVAVAIKSRPRTNTEPQNA